MPEYLQFAKTRMKSTIRNKIRGFVRSVPGGGGLVRKPKTGGQIKEKAAVKAAGKGPGTDATDPAVQNIIDNSDQVGHSWIKLSPIGTNGPIQTYSFGFIPANPGQAHGPQQAVGGQVRNPDLEFEGDGQNRYLDTTVSAKAYLQALTKIAQLKANPPQYMTIGYNCTQFTKDIARSAGADFPGKAGMMIPISDRGFMKRAMSPNALYSKLGAEQDVKSTSPESEMLEDPSYSVTSAGLAEDKPKGLELFDMMADEDAPKIQVKPEEEVIPRGNSFGTPKVEYQGRELFVVNTEALLYHLEHQAPKPRSKHRLEGDLIATSASTGNERTITGGRQIAVIDYNAYSSEVTVETDRSNWFQGSCDLLDFWKAVGGL
jgi:hypothetical protein